MLPHYGQCDAPRPCCHASYCRQTINCNRANGGVTVVSWKRTCVSTSFLLLVISVVPLNTNAFPILRLQMPRQFYTLGLIALLSVCLSDWKTDWKQRHRHLLRMTSHRQHVALRDSGCCWRDKEASSTCSTASRQLKSALIPILEEEVHVSDLRAPLPVIGRPRWRQILLYAFQMVETDDGAGEAPLIYRRPRCGYGSSWRRNSPFFLFSSSSSLSSSWHRCFLPLILPLDAAQQPPSISHRPTYWSILSIFFYFLSGYNLMRFSSSSCFDTGAALAPNFVMQIRLGS